MPEASKAFPFTDASHKVTFRIGKSWTLLAGLRINPASNMASRESHYYKITLLDIDHQIEYTINGLPENGKFCQAGMEL